MPSLNGWPNGMDNVHADNEIGSETLRRAVNLDITDSGKLRIRPGSTIALAVADAHSLWDDGNDNAYYLASNQLKKFNRDSTALTIGAVMAYDNPLSYVRVNDDTYFSCATARGRIRDDVLSPWGIEVPATPPVLSETTGNLNPGAYTAVMTYLLSDGRESGASRITSITLDAVGGIATTALPVPVDANVTKKRLYLTTANGEMLFMAKELNPSDQFATISNIPTGPELRTQFIIPPPYAAGLAYANGRIFMIDAEDPRVVWYTNAMAYDQVDKRRNYYVFPKDVTLIATTKGGGLYVCADKTYYIGAAGTESESFNTVFKYRGIARTAKIIPGTEEYIWMSERGAVIGHEGGAAEILSEKSLVPGDMTNAASMIREQNGIRQFVAVGNKDEGSSLQAGSYAEAEITRRA